MVHLVKMTPFMDPGTELRGKEVPNSWRSNWKEMMWETSNEVETEAQLMKRYGSSDRYEYSNE